MRIVERKNIDYEIGSFLLIGGIFGSTFGIMIFNFLKESGNIDLIISILYVIFLLVIGTLMLIESIISLVKEPQFPKSNLKKKKEIFWIICHLNCDLDNLEFIFRFFTNFFRIIHRFPCFS